jgi:hypothetical protein
MRLRNSRQILSIRSSGTGQMNIVIIGQRKLEQCELLSAKKMKRIYIPEI